VNAGKDMAPPKGKVMALDMALRHFEEKVDAARDRWQRAFNQPRPMRETLFALFEEAQVALRGAIARRDLAKAELNGERHLRAVGGERRKRG